MQAPMRCCSSHRTPLRLAALALLASACGSSDTASGPGELGNEPTPVPLSSCARADDGGSTVVETPELIGALTNRWREAWQGSPALVDLDGDGVIEILVPRSDRLYGWHADGSLVFETETEGRIWSSPVVVDLLPEREGLEVAVASGDAVFAWDSTGESLPGFPARWRDELRSLAAGDIDGDGDIELVAITTSRLEANGMRDIIIAFENNGAVVAGFPPNTTGASGCDDLCSAQGGFDQNVGLGDLDGDGIVDIIAPQDNSHMGVHDGSGRSFDAAAVFAPATKVLGVRFLHDYALAQQGWAPDEQTALQAHFTNSSPVVADIDGDGTTELLVLASVQNAAQDNRLQGVALWVLNADYSRPDAWLEPLHVPEYRAGLWDFDGTNVVGQNNSLAVVDLDPELPGLETIFAGFDGRLHAVDARGNSVFIYAYTQSDRVLTGGVVVADLSGDGVPEVIFNTYSPDEDQSALFILDAGGNELHRIALPDRGAMPIPSIGDVDGDGTLDIVVSLKDSEDDERQVLIYRVPGSGTLCLPWPTARGNLRRDGYVPAR